MNKVLTLIFLMLIGNSSFAQEDPNSVTIQDLDFLIGTWEVREDNEEKTWWEESTRVGEYILDSTYIQLKASAISSSGKERTYLWLIHFNSKAQQFEMVSMFSNWPKVQFDILTWEPNARKLIIKSGGDPNSDDYHDRYGELVFDKDFNAYTWIGENKYGDRENPNVWKYKELGSRKE